MMGFFFPHNNLRDNAELLSHGHQWYCISLGGQLHS